MNTADNKKKLELLSAYSDSILNNEDLSVYPPSLATYFKQKISYLGSILGIPSQPTKLEHITLLAKKYYIKSKNYPFITYLDEPEKIRKGRPRKSNKKPIPPKDVYKILIIYDFFKSQEKRAALLLLESFHFVLNEITNNNEKTYYNEKIDVSKQLAMVLSWLLAKKKEIRSFYEKIWEEYAPRIKYSATYIIDLKKYVISISKNAEEQYLQTLIQLIENSIKQKKPINIFDCFSLPTTLEYLTPIEHKVYIAAIHTINASLRDLASKTSINPSQISQIINRLKNIFLLRQRWFIDLKKLGLQSFIIGITGSHKKLQKIKDYSSSYLRNNLLFSNNNGKYIRFLNFYFPAHYYATRKINEWISETEDVLSKQNLEIAFCGFENLTLKKYVQRPELYSIKEKKWKIAFENKNKEIPFYNLINTSAMNQESNNGDYQLSPAHKGMALLLYSKGIFTFNGFFRFINEMPAKERKKLFLSKNRNILNHIYKTLKQNNIIELRYMMPFFEDLETFLLVLEGDEKDENLFEIFISNIANQLPITNNTFILGEKKYVISFLGVPKGAITLFSQKLISIFGSSIAFLGKRFGSLESTPVLNLIPTNNAWKFRTPPQLII